MRFGGAPLLLFAASLVGCSHDPGPISNGMLLPREAIAVARAWISGSPDPRQPPANRVEWISRPELAPFPHRPIPQHPFLAANPGSNMHDDASMSDTAEVAGPVGNGAEIRTRSRGFGGYGTIAFDRKGRIVGVYSNGRGFELQVLDADRLEQVASYPFPGRPWYWPLQGILPWKYIGAGMYFFLDERDRAVVPTTRNTIEVVQIPAGDGPIEPVRSYDLADRVIPMRWPAEDSIAWVLPDWSGRACWWATTGGMIGVIDLDSGAVRTHRLDGEVGENSFAVGEDGVFVVSDRALYRFHLADDGSVAVDWRSEYDRGPAAKPGHITRGSGTSVTLTGDRNGMVVITDNAEPRIHLLFVRRSDGSLACREPLFGEGRSGTDISAVAFESDDGRHVAVVENNWGYHSFPVAALEPGITRVDAERQTDGSYRCRTIWESREGNLGVMKASLGNGLLYTYFRRDDAAVDQFGFSTIDLRDGRTVSRVHAGSGQGFNNWSGALFLSPRGVVYTTTIFGLVEWRDEHPGRTDAPPG